jgi:hypothetical protein
VVIKKLFIATLRVIELEFPHYILLVFSELGIKRTCFWRHSFTHEARVVRDKDALSIIGGKMMLVIWYYSVQFATDNLLIHVSLHLIHWLNFAQVLNLEVIFSVIS